MPVPYSADREISILSSPPSRWCILATQVTNGKRFPYATGNERGNYKLHVDFHRYETADCGCGNLVFKSKKEAKRHHLLHHSQRDYVKCPQCHVVVQSKYLERHEWGFHKDFVCNDCRKVFLLDQQCQRRGF